MMKYVEWNWPIHICKGDISRWCNMVEKGSKKTTPEISFFVTENQTIIAIILKIFFPVKLENALRITLCTYTVTVRIRCIIHIIDTKILYNSH